MGTHPSDFCCMVNQQTVACAIEDDPVDDVAASQAFFGKVLEDEVNLLRGNVCSLTVGRFDMRYGIGISLFRFARHCRDDSLRRRLIRVCGCQLEVLKGVTVQPLWVARPNYKHGHLLDVSDL